MFLHGFQQGGLRLGRRAVDFVGQDHVGEDRAVQELELRAGRWLVFLDHFGAGDVRGHQVGRELDAAETQRTGVGQRADHQRLGQAGHADQQAMAAGEDGDQQFFDHLLLADDHLAQFVGDALVGVVQFWTAWTSSSWSIVG